MLHVESYSFVVHGVWKGGCGASVGVGVRVLLEQLIDPC